MAAAVETFTHHSQSPVHLLGADPVRPAKSSTDFFAKQSTPPRMGHYLDDTDLLTLKRQYANFNFFEQSVLSNSADDLSQLDRFPYPTDIFVQDPIDIDDDDMPYDDAGADYFLSIKDRLKKANDEFQQDQNSTELAHKPRVIFDTVVKAVDIVVESEEMDDVDRPPSATVTEEPPATAREYTVPLNDTYPKEGLTLVQQIKAVQFHNTPDVDDDRWATAASNPTIESKEDTTVAAPAPVGRNSMVVSVNGQFDLQNEDDYTAIHSTKPKTDAPQKPVFVPTPPAEPKKQQDKPPRPFLVRPKSSETARKTAVVPGTRSKTDSAARQRPKSAGVSKSIEAAADKPPSGVDFDELLRQAATKKRAEQREERRKKEEEDEKHRQELEKARESYERWLEDKKSERKRVSEEKRMEKEEERARQVEQQHELDELREKKFKEWLDRKDHEALMANEFQKLKASDDEHVDRRSALSTTSSNNSVAHRAFRRWLRQKHEQELEEKRRVRLEAKQRRRRDRRSIKRQQLQQDIQLAKSYGYS